MKFYRVNPTSREILDELHGEGGCKIGPIWVPAARLPESHSIYPLRMPDYNPATQVLSALYFDESARCVTARVHDFEPGIRHKWKATDFIETENGWQLVRGIRVTVLHSDCCAGGMLEAKANEAMKNMSPFLRIDENRNRDDFGDRFELYLNYISEADAQLLNQYFALRGARTGVEYAANLH